MRRRGSARPPQPVEWNFRSFPVAFAFAAGAFLATLVASHPNGIVFIVTLFATSFGLAHIVGHWYRRHILDRRRDLAEEEERERRALAARAAARAREEAPATDGARRRRRRRT